MAIHPLEAQLTGRILKTARETYSDLLATRPFLETNIRQTPAQLIELMQYVAQALDNPRTGELLKELLQEAGAKVPSDLYERISPLLTAAKRGYVYSHEVSPQIAMTDLTNPSAIRLNTGQPATEAQLRNLIFNRLQRKYRLQPDTLKTLAAVIGVPGEQYQALRESLPETPWVVPARDIYSHSRQASPDSGISLIDLTGNDPFRLPVGLLNTVVQTAVPRIKLPNPRYGGGYTLQVPDLVLESALLEQAMRDYIYGKLADPAASPLSLYTLGELVGALRAIQPALIDQFVNSPEGQRILRESALPGAEQLIEDVKTQLRQGFVPGLSSSAPNDQALKQGLENVRVGLNALNLPEWMRRRLPALKAEIVDPTIATDAINTLQKMVLVAAAPELLQAGIDPMKASTPQVMHAVRELQTKPRLSDYEYLFDIISRGRIQGRERPVLGREPDLPFLLAQARSLDPRVEKLPPFQELTVLAGFPPRPTPKASK